MDKDTRKQGQSRYRTVREWGPGYWMYRSVRVTESSIDDDLCAICEHSRYSHHLGPNADECTCGCSYFRES